MSGPTGSDILFRGSSKGRQPEDYLPKAGFQYSDVNRLTKFPPFTPDERDAWFDAFLEISPTLDKEEIDKAMAQIWRAAAALRAESQQQKQEKPGDGDDNNARSSVAGPLDRDQARELAIERAADELGWAARMGELPLDHVMRKMEQARSVDNRLAAFRRPTSRGPGHCAGAIDDFTGDRPRPFEPDAHAAMTPERFHDMAYRMRNRLRSDWSHNWLEGRKLGKKKRVSDQSWRDDAEGEDEEED